MSKRVVIRFKTDPIIEMISLEIKIIFFPHQEFMFQPCRLFAERYRALILGAAHIESQFPLSWKVKSDAAKRLNRCFNKEFSGVCLQVTKKQWLLRDFLQRVNDTILDKIRIDYLNRYMPRDISSIITDMT